MKRAILFPAIALLLGCSPSLSVLTDQDPSYATEQYLTYNWQSFPDVTDQYPLSQENDARIRNAVDEQLAFRGYMQLASDAEVSLHYHIIVRDKPISAPVYDACLTMNGKRRIEIFSAFQEGTLIVDLIDTRNQELAWRGIAAAPIDNIHSAEKTEALIRKAITKMFRDFPRSQRELSPNDFVSASKITLP